jgi:hypothetical protein
MTEFRQFARPKMGRRIGFHADQAARLRNGTCAAVGAAICGAGAVRTAGVAQPALLVARPSAGIASEEVLVSAFPTVALGPTNANRACRRRLPPGRRQARSLDEQLIKIGALTMPDSVAVYAAASQRCPSCRYYSRRGSQVRRRFVGQMSEMHRTTLWAERRHPSVGAR